MAGSAAWISGRSGAPWAPPAEASAAGDREAHAVAHAADDAARQWGARAIVVYTQTGSTARILSKLKPPCAIVAFAPTEEARRRMALYRGVVPLHLRLATSTDRMLRDGQSALLRSGLLERGDRVVVVSGTTPRAGATSLMKLHRLGDRL